MSRLQLLTAPVDPDRELEALEISLLLEALLRRYGYDFRGYAVNSLRRRILACVAQEGGTIAGLMARVLHEPGSLERLLGGLTVHATSMFRDPAFYVAFREKVVPLLQSCPSIRIWHAGCASGEEVYSLAILLHEEGLLGRCQVYATDLSKDMLRRARAAAFPLSAMPHYAENYRRAGGRGRFADYYTVESDGAVFRPFLHQPVVFAEHNLVTDTSFNEFQVILCRNVLIYFKKPLQNRVQTLLYESLASSGVLALGDNESIRFTSYEDRYEGLDNQQRLYRKVN